MKNEDKPLMSGVFLSDNSFVALRISEMETGELERLKVLLHSAIFSVGDLSVGLILRTISAAAVAKNLLKLSAISKGLLMLRPFIFKDEKLLF